MKRLFLILCICFACTICACSNADEVRSTIPEDLLTGFTGNCLVVCYYTDDGDGATVINLDNQEVVHLELTGDSDGFDGLDGLDTIVNCPIIDLPEGFNWFEDWQSIFEGINFDSAYLDTEYTLLFGTGYKIPESDEGTWYRAKFFDSYIQVMEVTENGAGNLFSVESWTLTDAEWDTFKSEVRE